MLLHVLRAVFVLILAAVTMSYIAADMEDPTSPLSFLQYNKPAVLMTVVVLALLVIIIDLFIPHKSLLAVSGLFFGVIIGMVMAYGLSLIVGLGVESLYPDLRQPVHADVWVDKPMLHTDEQTGASIIIRQRVLEKQVVAYRDHPFVSTVKIIIGVICCYLAVSFIIQTKDDVRFVIPYVEFAKQPKGARPLLLDTSVVIDGRIADICETGVIDSELIVPRFILQELQLIADSGDKLKRTRGRRGLDVLNRMQLNERINVKILDVRMERGDSHRTVDEMLVELGGKTGGRIVTNDYNLNKVAKLRGVPVININDLANAVKPIFLPGEELLIKILKPGDEPGQGIGYLDDGTMVVAEGGREHIGETIPIWVTSVLQTSAGRMIFGRSDGAAPPPRRGRSAEKPT